MAKRNGNGASTNFLAELFEHVVDLRSELKQQGGAIEGQGEAIERLSEATEQLLIHTRRMDQRLAKMAKTLSAAANLLDDHEQRLRALEHG
jgi:ABC-type transporter Mla subunit MlaD